MTIIEQIFNFDNIGKKIKNFAKYACWITIIITWVAGVIGTLYFLFDGDTILLCFIPPIVAFIASFLIWVSFWIPYAFGELVDKISSGVIATTASEEKTKPKKTNIQKNTTKKSSNKNIPISKTTSNKTTSHITANKHSDDEYNDVECPECGNTISILKGETRIQCPHCDAEYEISW